MQLTVEALVVVSVRTDVQQLPVRYRQVLQPINVFPPWDNNFVSPTIAQIGDSNYITFLDDLRQHMMCVVADRHCINFLFRKQAITQIATCVIAGPNNKHARAEPPAKETNQGERDF